MATISHGESEPSFRNVANGSNAMETNRIPREYSPRFNQTAKELEVLTQLG